MSATHSPPGAKASKWRLTRSAGHCSRGALRVVRGDLAWRTPRQAQVDGGLRPGTTTDEAQRIKELEKEVRELRRANAILKSTVGLSITAECERPSR